MRPIIQSLVAAVLLLVPVGAAQARQPRVASDAFYVGMRVEPGIALLAGWDLDVYLNSNRAVSIGPGVSVSVLGAGERAGMVQDLLVAADVLRLKVQVNDPGGEWRPYVLAGGGFTYARLPEQVVEGVTLSDGTMGDQRLPSLNEYAPMMTLGFGADWFAGGTWGLALLLQTHFHLSGTERVPVVWSEIAAGIRFGI